MGSQTSSKISYNSEKQQRKSVNNQWFHISITNNFLRYYTGLCQTRGPPISLPMILKHPQPRKPSKSPKTQSPALDPPETNKHTNNYVHRSTDPSQAHRIINPAPINQQQPLGSKEKSKQGTAQPKNNTNLSTDSRPPENCWPTNSKLTLSISSTIIPTIWTPPSQASLPHIITTRLPIHQLRRMIV